MNKLKFIENISSLKESEFDDLNTNDDSPFTKYGFLNSLEESRCVSTVNGWKPNHLAIFNKKKLGGFIPLYLKNNSHGEFVFDHPMVLCIK
jgi:Uncharacterized protein conserved in bacteria